MFLLRAVLSAWATAPVVAAPSIRTIAPASAATRSTDRYRRVGRVPDPSEHRSTGGAGTIIATPIVRPPSDRYAFDREVLETRQSHSGQEIVQVGHPQRARRPEGGGV